MKRDYIDFHEVPERQAAIHERLLNWARSLNGPVNDNALSMWRRAKSSDVWSLSSIADPYDRDDAHKIARAVAFLPEKHRKAIQWHYVMQTSVERGRKYVVCTREELAALVIDSRDMLRNRGV